MQDNISQYEPIISSIWTNYMFTNIMVVIFARKLRLTYEVLTTIDLVVMYAHLVEDYQFSVLFLLEF